MNTDLTLSGVAPGPACVIPEDKKIFRVTGYLSADFAVAGEGACDAAAHDGADAPPLPVPNRFSA